MVDISPAALLTSDAGSRPNFSEWAACRHHHVCLVLRFHKRRYWRSMVRDVPQRVHVEAADVGDEGAAEGWSRARARWSRSPSCRPTRQCAQIARYPSAL